MMEEIAIEPKQTFWIMSINLLGDRAAIEWCKIFGSWNEDTHWTRTIPKARHDEIRDGLFNATSLNQEKWEAYRNNIIGYRDQMVVHHDLDTTVAKYPHYDSGLAAAFFMFDQLRNIADPSLRGGIPNSLDRWSRTVTKNMNSIVKKSFEASATLGSNLPKSVSS
jgi:hypothetical protein